MSRFKIEYLQNVSSTNDYAMTLDEDDILVMTYDQSTGKGRLGRSWVCEPGEAIAMSLRLKPQIKPQSSSMLTLLAAVALIRSLPVKCEIKWPNDIICNKKKLCGILTESRFSSTSIEYVIIGIGINVDMKHFEGELGDKATSIFIETGVSFDKMKIADDFLDEFEVLYDEFVKRESLDFIMEEYNSHLVNRNCEVDVISDETKRGIALGIDEGGALLVQYKEGIARIVSGEVSVRGINGYV